MKSLIVCNALIDISVVFGVVYAAIHFNNVNVLWWLLIILVTGYNASR